MSCHLFNRLFILIIHLINALSLLILCRAYQFAFFHGNSADIDTVIRFIRYHFSNNILRPLQRFRRCFYGFCSVFIFTDILLSFILNGFRSLLRQNELCQTVQPFLLRHARPRLFLRTVRTI